MSQDETTGEISVKPQAGSRMCVCCEKSSSAVAAWRSEEIRGKRCKHRSCELFYDPLPGTGTGIEWMGSNDSTRGTTEMAAEAVLTEAVKSRDD